MNWIKGAINPAHKGALHAALHIKQGKRIPAKMLTAAAHMKGRVGREARLAETLRKFHH